MLKINNLPKKNTPNKRKRGGTGTAKCEAITKKKRSNLPEKTNRHRKYSTDKNRRPCPDTLSHRRGRRRRKKTKSGSARPLIIQSQCAPPRMEQRGEDQKARGTRARATSGEAPSVATYPRRRGTRGEGRGRSEARSDLAGRITMRGEQPPENTSADRRPC